MASNWNGIERRKSLRVAAETLVTHLSPDMATAQPGETLFHELIVHKIELEMQVEELRSTHAALEEALERFRLLYEFTPIAYVTVDREGVVTDINRAGLELLGVSHAMAADENFSAFVAAEDKELWRGQIVDLSMCAKGCRKAFDLKIIKADGSGLPVQLDCLCWKTQDAPAVMQLALRAKG